MIFIEIRKSVATGDNNSMSFWAHFDVLRGVLFRIGALIVLLSVLFFIFMPQIFNTVILAPCNCDFPLYKLFDEISGATDHSFEVSLINIRLASQLSIHLSTSFELALVVGFPIVIYLLWGFISPALYPHERQPAVRAFVAGNLMFYLGVAVGYFLIFPLTLRFLATYQLSEAIPNTITIDSYMDNFTVIILVMGIVFEMPLLGWLLGKMGLITRNFFAKYRRHAVVALLVLAALITPTGDPFTLCVVFIPLYLLYEATAMTVKPQVP